MRKRKWLIISGGIVAIAIAWSALRAALAPTPGVTLTNFKRLHIGMSIKQVKAILGEMGEEWHTFERLHTEHWIWHRDNVSVQIAFTKDRKDCKALWGEWCVNNRERFMMRDSPLTLKEKFHDILGIK